PQFGTPQVGAAVRPVIIPPVAPIPVATREITGAAYPPVSPTQQGGVAAAIARLWPEIRQAIFGTGQGIQRGALDYLGVPRPQFRHPQPGEAATIASTTGISPLDGAMGMGPADNPFQWAARQAQARARAAAIPAEDLKYAGIEEPAGNLWYQGVGPEGKTTWVTSNLEKAKIYAKRRGAGGKIHVYTPEQVGENAFADQEGNLMSPQEYARTQSEDTTIQTLATGKLPQPIRTLDANGNVIPPEVPPTPPSAAAAEFSASKLNPVRGSGKFREVYQLDKEMGDALEH